MALLYLLLDSILACYRINWFYYESKTAIKQRCMYHLDKL